MIEHVFSKQRRVQHSPDTVVISIDVAPATCDIYSVNVNGIVYATMVQLFVKQLLKVTTVSCTGGDIFPVPTFALLVA